MIISLGIAGVAILLFVSMVWVVPLWGLVVLIVFAVIYAAGAARVIRHLERSWRKRRGPGAAGMMSRSPSGDWLLAEEHHRDPVWRETLAALRCQRREILDRFQDAEDRRTYLAIVIRAGYGDSSGDAETELAAIGDDLRIIRRDAFRDWQSRGGSGEFSLWRWSGVDRDEIVALPRPVVAVTDCRYGHVAHHEIMPGSEPGAVRRRCSVCAPATSWIETGDSE